MRFDEPATDVAIRHTMANSPAGSTSKPALLLRQHRLATYVLRGLRRVHPPRRPTPSTRTYPVASRHTYYTHGYQGAVGAILLERSEFLIAIYQEKNLCVCATKKSLRVRLILVLVWDTRVIV